MQNKVCCCFSSENRLKDDFGVNLIRQVTNKSLWILLLPTCLPITWRKKDPLSISERRLSTYISLSLSLSNSPSLFKMKLDKRFQKEKFLWSKWSLLSAKEPKKKRNLPTPILKVFVYFSFRVNSKKNFFWCSKRTGGLTKAKTTSTYITPSTSVASTKAGCVVDNDIRVDVNVNVVDNV